MTDNNTPNLPAKTVTTAPAVSNDFDAMVRMSQMLAKSSLVPAAYRGKPENVLLATLAGQPFGWDPTMAMRSFHVIEGQPSLKPEIMLALVRRAGHSVTGETRADGAVITGKRRDTGDTMTVGYTLEDARRANLLGKSVWKQYPQSMCWARALSQLCRMLFPDVVLGAGYTAEELGAEVTHDGDVIEATVVRVDEPTVTGTPVVALKKELVKFYEGDKGAAKTTWEAVRGDLADDTTPLTDDEVTAFWEGVLALGDAGAVEAPAADEAADTDEVDGY